MEFYNQRRCININKKEVKRRQVITPVVGDNYSAKKILVLTPCYQQKILLLI
jgi:hypothetical protein